MTRVESGGGAVGSLVVMRAIWALAIFNDLQTVVVEQRHQGLFGGDVFPTDGQGGFGLDLPVLVRLAVTDFRIDQVIDSRLAGQIFNGGGDRNILKLDQGYGGRRRGLGAGGAARSGSFARAGAGPSLHRWWPRGLRSRGSRRHRGIGVGGRGSFVRGCSAGCRAVESAAVAGWAAGATSSELAGFVAMVSVWDNAPCCHTRHPSSVAISIFVFILLSPIRLRFVFMLNMDCKISGGVRPFWAAASFVASDVERKFHARGQSMM